ncbi:MAG: OmpH family outer membrane protein [Proteobacteria bacterium]|nr:OmpH family outer membrane protein [Pseudomonadota bacterium]
MRLFNKTVLVGAALFFMLGIYAYAADAAKIGVVDFRKILEESNTGISGRAEIKKQGEMMEVDLKKKGAELEELKKQYEKNAMVTKKDVTEEKQLELKAKYEKFMILQKQYNADIQNLQKSFFVSLKNEVDLVVDAICKKEKYQIIIEKNAVFYSPPSIDITDKVIQQLNAKSALQPGK